MKLQSRANDTRCRAVPQRSCLVVKVRHSHEEVSPRNYKNRLYDGVCHIPLGRFPQARLLGNQESAPTPNDTCSQSSRRDVSNAAFFGTATVLPTIVEILSNRCGDINHGKSAQVGCDKHGRKSAESRNGPAISVQNGTAYARADRFSGETRNSAPVIYTDFNVEHTLSLELRNLPCWASVLVSCGRVGTVRAQSIFALSG